MTNESSSSPPPATTSTTATTTASIVRTDSSKYTGRVKWFNNKFGYGFITVVSTDADASAAIGSDVFAHHSEVSVGEDQYRYLVQGEYVEFSVVKTTSGNHEFQCSAIRGIHGGQLICETRHNAREQYNKTSNPSNPSNLSSSTSTLPRTHSQQAPQSSSGSGFGGEHRFSGVRPATRGGRGGFSGGASGRGGRGGGGGGSSGGASTGGGFHN